MHGERRGHNQTGDCNQMRSGATMSHSGCNHRTDPTQLRQWPEQPQRPGHIALTRGLYNSNAPHMRLINRDQLEAATSGNADLQAEWECADGTGIHISRTADSIEAA
jgi:hypothetical protein